MSRLRAKRRRRLSPSNRIRSSVRGRVAHRRQHDGDADHAPGPLSGHGRGCDAGDAPVPTDDQRQSYGHVGDVNRGLQQQRGSGMLPSQKVTEDGVIGQCCRCRPDADTAIHQRVAMHFAAGAQQCQRRGNERLLEDENQSSDEQRGEERAGKVVHELILVARSLRLRDQPSGGHAQEAEGPKDRIEKDAANRNAPQCRRPGQMAGKNRIHRGEQRLGEVRKNQWEGEEKHSPVPVGRSHSVSLFSNSSRLAENALLYEGHGFSRAVKEFA